MSNFQKRKSYLNKRQTNLDGLFLNSSNIIAEFTKQITKAINESKGLMAVKETVFIWVAANSLWFLEFSAASHFFCTKWSIPIFSMVKFPLKINPVGLQNCDKEHIYWILFYMCEKSRNHWYHLRWTNDLNYDIRLEITLVIFIINVIWRAIDFGGKVDFYMYIFWRAVCSITDIFWSISLNFDCIYGTLFVESKREYVSLFRFK